MQSDALHDDHSHNIILDHDTLQSRLLDGARHPICRSPRYFCNTKYVVLPRKTTSAEVALAFHAPGTNGSCAGGPPYVQLREVRLGEVTGKLDMPPSAQTTMIAAQA
jgi:hypothetical protein